jgi:hypothetical protein
MDKKAALPWLVKAGRALRLIGWAVLAFTGLYWAAIVVQNLGLRNPSNMLPPLLFTASITTAICLFCIYVGMSLMKMKPWSRFGGVAMGIFMLTLPPIFIPLGLYILWCMFKGWHEISSK